MSFNLYKSLITEGLAAARPAIPDQPDFRQFYFATDTGAFSLWSPKLQAWANQGASGVATALTASTTQTRAGALALTAGYNNVATVANANDAVGLPPITFVGQEVWVTNSAGVNAMGVFPDNTAAGANVTIDGGSAGAKVTVSAAKSALFTAITATAWQSIGSAARAA